MGMTTGTLVSYILVMPAFPGNVVKFDAPKINL